MIDDRATLSSRTRRSCTSHHQGTRRRQADQHRRADGAQPGDIDEGFAEADVIVEREFTTPTVHQGYIEPHACWSRVAPTARPTIWCSSQGQFMVRAMRRILTASRRATSASSPPRSAAASAARPRLSRAARDHCWRKKSGRPVKMVMTRDEVFRATGPTSRLEEQGEDRRQERRHASSPPRAPSICRPAPSRARRSAGAQAAASRPTTSRTCSSKAYDVVSNRPKVAAYRAPGAPIVVFRGRMRDRRDRRKLWMDPIELRLKNAAKEGTKAAHGPTFRPHRLTSRRWKPRRTRASRTARRRSAASGARRGVRLLVQRRRRIERAGQHHRGRQRRGHHRPPRHRRLARRIANDRRRAARHRLHARPRA